MASHNENSDVLMLPISDSSSRTRPFTAKSRSVSLANKSSTIDGLDSSSHYNRKDALNPTSIDPVDSTSRNGLYGNAKHWAKGFADRYLLKIISPHSKTAQNLNKWFAISCLLPIFVDPLFVFLIHVKGDDKCLSIDMKWARIYAAFKSVSDFFLLIHMLGQFRLAYVAPESTVVGAGQLVYDRKKIALRYVRGKFTVDFFIMLPLAQILILWFIPKLLGVSGTNYAKNLVVFFVLYQYIPKLSRLLPFLAGGTTTGFMFKSNWANFLINLSTFMLAGHFIGSCWYFLGMQRVKDCLRDACPYQDKECRELIDCDRNDNLISMLLKMSDLSAWKDNVNASACFQKDGFDYGIYSKTVNLTTDSNPANRYIYSFFWGFQQISTLAGNQVPSYYFWEVLFTTAIVGLGLLLVALLIGNMQQFLQGLGRRNLETTLKRRDVEKWMSHRQLPESIKKKVKKAERFNWASTRGFNEELIFENMPDDLQREIKRHLFAFIKNASIFSEMDDPVLDAIYERLKQKTYTKKSTVFHPEGLVDKMVFIVSGKMESTKEDGTVLTLSKGDVCGEELLTWCLERSSTNSDETRKRLPSKGLLSKTTFRCVKKVEAFYLSVEDLEEVMSLFPGFPRSNSSGLEISKETT